jgi:uncharacterized protein (DUF362 family)
MSKSKVAVIFTKPETVIDDYARLMDLAGAKDALDPEATTILKDNISWHYPMPSANSTPWQLEGVIRALNDMGFKDQVCVQNETVVIDTHKGEDLNNFTPVFKRYDIPIKYNYKPEDMTWVEYKPEATMHALDHIYPDGIQIPDFFLGKNIVHLPTAKCHIYTETTGAMKNAFGGLLYNHRHYTHSWIHEVLVDLLAIQKEIHPGVFAVMDGTTAGNGPGPRTMTPVVKNCILASADQVAIDAVSAKLMGFDPMKIEYINLGHQDKLGVGDVRDIEIVGDSIEGEDWGFEVGQSLHKFLGWLSWYGPTKAFQDYIFKTPLVKIPIFVSEANHDYIHWPLKERQVYRDWKKNTGWGQLFAEYQKKGALK